MSGYNVTFDSVFTGSLCGKWPDTAVWLILLALRDQHGHIDVTPEYISRISGVPIETLEECIGRFMSPDPRSRTVDDEGRRLRLIYPDRPWGWIVINHGSYKERARLMGKNRREVESGTNAGRMADRRGPPGTAANRLATAEATTTSEAGEDLDSDLAEDSLLEAAQVRHNDEFRLTREGEPEPDGAAAPTAKTAKTPKTAARGDRLPKPWPLTPERRKYAEQQGIDAERTHTKFCNHWWAKPGREALKLDWDGTWQNWCLTEAEHRPVQSRRADQHDRKHREFGK